MATIFLFRRKTAAEWTSANPVLLSGELGLETDTTKFKFGNGSTAWNSLAYAGASVGVVPWGAINGTLSDQTDLAAALNAKQPTLIAGTNIKTVNGNSLLGVGDLAISGASITVQDEGSNITTALGTMNFVGAGVTVTGGTTATVTIPGGSVSDGDKGDITVSSGGTVWTIDAGAVSLAKMADLASSTILGRVTAGTGVPEALTAAQVRTLLNVADGATANASDAFLLARANHTGTQDASTITGLAAIATSGSAADLSSGTIPAARFDDTAHGSRSGGALHAAATTSVAGFMSGADKTKLDAITGTNTGDQTSIVGITGTKAEFDTAVTDGNFLYVGDSIPAAQISDSTAAGRAVLTAADAAAQTALLDTFTSGAKGLVPASGGGTTNFLRADGTFAAPAGGGSGDVEGPASATDNAIARFDGTTGKLIQDSAVQVRDSGALWLPTAAPAVPDAGSLALFNRDVSGRAMPAFMGPSGLDTPVQPFFGRNKIGMWQPNGNGTTVQALGFTSATTGTATAENVATTNRYTYMRRIAYRVTTASTTAVVGFRSSVLQYSCNANAAGAGGFHMVIRWGVSTGGTNGSHRAFVGISSASGAPTDIDPSTRLSMLGMAYDATDTNIQFMHNDSSGTATKIDLGASFPKPSADGATSGDVYELALFAPPGTTRVAHYEVTNLQTGAVATGTVTTDLPATTQLLTPLATMSVGGVSSVVGIAIMGFYIETDY